MKIKLVRSKPIAPTEDVATAALEEGGADAVEERSDHATPPADTEAAASQGNEPSSEDKQKQSAEEPRKMREVCREVSASCAKQATT